jgi:hypothetical protein
LFPACSSQDYDDLTRVDVQKVEPEMDYEDTVILSDEEVMDELRVMFKQIKWEPSKEVSMERKEDALVTLFYILDENEPERLYEYRVCFNDNNDAEIISNHEKEGFGSLGREHSIKLQSILMN